MSYFFVGYIAVSPFVSKSDSEIVIPESNEYFAFENYEPAYCISFGKFIQYKKDFFDLNDAVDKYMTDNQNNYSNAATNMLSRQVLKCKSFYHTDEKDGYKITYSPIVLQKNRFLSNRTNYCGFLILEKDDDIIFIPYHFLTNGERFIDEVFFTDIYSKNYETDISKIFNNSTNREGFDKVYFG